MIIDIDIDVVVVVVVVIGRQWYRRWCGKRIDILCGGGE